MNTKTLPIVATLALALFACGGSKTNSANLSLSAKAVAATTTPATPSTPTTTPTTPASLDLGNGISLTEVRVLVRKLKLEGAVAAATDGGASTSATPPSAPPSMSDAGGDGKTEVEKEQDTSDEPVLGPVLIDLKDTTLASGIGSVFDSVVPQGTFSEFKAAIGPVTAAEAGSDKGLADMASKNASVVVAGTITGSAGAKSFEFVSSMALEIKKETETEVNDTKSNNVTLSLDASKWFSGGGSTALDPSDPANKAAIEANIKASINAFEDDNKSGHENHGGGKAGGGTDTGTGHP
jgi:hypothetical protein